MSLGNNNNDDISAALGFGAIAKRQKTDKLLRKSIT